MGFLLRMITYILIMLAINFRDFIWKDEFFQFSSKRGKMEFLIRNACAMILFFYLLFILDWK